MDLASQLASLRLGEHLCLVHGGDRGEQLPALIPFFRDGIAGGERCLSLADEQACGDLEAALELAGTDVRRERARSALQLRPLAKWHHPGELDSAPGVHPVGAAIAEAVALGFSGMRVAVDVSWVLGGNVDGARLRHFEGTLETIVQRIPNGFPVTILCLYSKRQLPAAAVQVALAMHPFVILGGDLCPNQYYEGPLGLELGNEEAGFEWMLAAVQERKSRLSTLAARVGSAHEVHAEMVHSLFSLGLEWQVALADPRSGAGHLRAAIDDGISTLQEVIRDIRRSIEGLEGEVLALGPVVRDVVSPEPWLGSEGFVG